MNSKLLFPLAIAGTVSASSCFLLGNIQEPFSPSEVATMRGYFLKNINIEGKGGVVAAPDTGMLILTLFLLNCLTYLSVGRHSWWFLLLSLDA